MIEFIKQITDFATNNIELFGTILGAILWLLARLKPSGKNWDIFEMVIVWLDEKLKNYSNELDANGNKLTHREVRELKKIKRKAKSN